MHRDTHHGDQGLLLLEMVFVQHGREGILQRLTGLHHDPHCLSSEGNLQPETHTHVHFNNLPHKVSTNYKTESNAEKQQYKVNKL